MASLATALNAKAGKPGRWFDGFWDFVVENRSRFLNGPAWEISGFTLQRPWSLLVLAAAAEADPPVEIYLFVEAKDRRPSIRAPWPVSTLTIPGEGGAEEGRPDALDRPHDKELAAAIARLGFTPRVGYWGIRCDWCLAPNISVDAVAAVVRAALAEVPSVLPLALKLAGTA